MNPENLMQTLLDAKDEHIGDFRKELMKRDDAIKDEIARREKELVRKDDAIKEEIARREKELAAKDEAIKNEAERREREVASRDKELKIKEQQLSAMQDSSATYRSASLFLLIIALTSIAVIWNRQMELKVALEKYSNCTQQLLHLTKLSGTGHLEELQELRDENKKLIELKGECIVYKNNENTTAATALTIDKHTDNLMEMLKSRDNQVVSESEKKEECNKLLKTCQDESNQLKGTLQEIASERDVLKTKCVKCSHELIACQEVREPSG